VESGSETVIQVVIADDIDGSSAKVVAYDVKKLIQNGMHVSALAFLLDVLGDRNTYSCVWVNKC